MAEIKGSNFIVLTSSSAVELARIGKGVFLIRPAEEAAFEEKYGEEEEFRPARICSYEVCVSPTADNVRKSGSSSGGTRH